MLEYIVAQNVVENAQANGVYLGQRLKEALGDSPIVGDIRVSQQVNCVCYVAAFVCSRRSLRVLLRVAHAPS